MATKIVKEEVIRIRVEKQLKDRLKKMCKDKKMNMSKLIIYMIENEINKYEFKIRNRKEIEDRVKVIDRKIDRLRYKKDWY